MELWLSRQHNGLYMLTYLKPLLHQVEGRDFQDFYIQPGEPVGERNFCDLILKLVSLPPLKKLESVRVIIEGRLNEVEGKQNQD